MGPRYSKSNTSLYLSKAYKITTNLSYIMKKSFFMQKCLTKGVAWVYHGDDDKGQRKVSSVERAVVPVRVSQ